MKSFAVAARAAMRALPAYRFVRTTGGSGPLVEFRAPARARRVTQTVVFQKGLYGGAWFRVNVYTSFDRHAIDHATMRDVRFSTDAELVAALARAVKRLDALATRRAARVAEQARTLAAMLDPAQVKRWMAAEGHALAPGLFDPDDLANGAFARFRRWLRARGRYVVSGELALWQWWCDHHPRKKQPPPVRVTASRVELRHRRKKPIVLTIKKGELEVQRDGGCYTTYASVREIQREAAAAIRAAKREGYREV